VPVVRVDRLPNGITVASENLAHFESVSIGFWLKAGARNERDGEHGIAHLLEHMAFKGTNRRSAEQIAVEIENVGGEINAATSSENTSYFARVLKDDLPLAVDILCDILTDSLFDESELEREKHVILQEIGAAFDTPDDIVFDKFTEAAWIGQTVGRSILGTPESVQAITAADLKAFVAREYFGERMVIVAAGNIDHDALVGMIADRLGTMARSNPSAIIVEPAQYTGGSFRETRDLMDAQIVLGFEGKANFARDFYASQVLAMLMGGGMSSRLFQQVREKRGLCYSIYAFHWSFSDTGLFGIHAATQKEDVAELLDVVRDELFKVVEHVDIAEVDRARAQFRAGLLMSQESAVSRSGQIGRQLLLHGRPVAMEETMDRLAAITPARLTDLAGRMFMQSPLTLAALGPIDGLPDAAALGIGQPPKLAQQAMPLPVVKQALPKANRPQAAKRAAAG
jgi:predicted Zn-dependent peptidase